MPTTIIMPVSIFIVSLLIKRYCDGRGAIPKCWVKFITKREKYWRVKWREFKYTDGFGIFYIFYS
jgi:hypothetical protein